MREENDPVVSNEVVEVDGTVGGFSIEVGGDAAQTKGLRSLVGRHCDGVICGDLWIWKKSES